MRVPIANYSPDMYRFRWESEHIDLRMDRLHEARGGDLTAEVEVRISRDVPDLLVHHAKMNVISSRSRADVIRALAARVPESTEVDWHAVIEQASHLTLRRWREGDPVVNLRDVPPRSGTRFLLAPFVEYGGPTVLFADGGSGKSLLALAIGTSIAAGASVLGEEPSEQRPTLYLDWESDAETHADRLRALLAGAGLRDCAATVLYRRQSASLAESAPFVRRVVTEEGVGFVVVDSMGAARGGEPESADSTIRLFNAARSLGVPWLGVDHVTKNGDSGKVKPFGSVYTHNLARLTWGLEKVEDYGNGDLIVAATNHKANNGRLLGRRGFAVTIREDEDGRPQLVTYAPKEVKDVPALIRTAGLPQQIAEVLAANPEPLTVEDIQRCLQAEAVEVKANVIRMTLNRYKQRFVSTGTRDRQQTWGLLSQREPAF